MIEQVPSKERVQQLYGRFTTTSLIFTRSHTSELFRIIETLYEHIERCQQAAVERAAPEPCPLPPPPYPGDEQAVRDAGVQLPACLCDRGQDDPHSDGCQLWAAVLAARQQWHDKHVAAWSCSLEAQGRIRCAHWCGTCVAVGTDRRAAQPPVPDDARDAARYRRLQILGCAPSGSTELKLGLLMRFTNLDAFVDADIKAHPSRGECSTETKGEG
jgi:hypothetical protein